MASQSGATADEPERPAELQAPGYEIFIALLAVLSLINLAISILPVEEYQKQIASIINIPITVIFLSDFTMRLLRSIRGASTSSSSGAGSTCWAACLPGSSSSGSSASSASIG